MVGVVALVRQAIASVQPASPVAWLCSMSFYEAFANEGVDVSSEFGRALVSMSVNRMGGIPVVKSESIEDGCAFLMGAKGEVLKQVRLPFKFQHAPECLYCHGHLPDLADCPACLGTGTFTENERSAFLHGTAIQKSWEEWKLELTEMRRMPPEIVAETEPEVRQLHTDQSVGLRAPKNGFIVDVSTRDLMSDAASSALIGWLRGVVLTWFARDQNRRIVLNFTDGAEFHHHPEAAANVDHTCAAWVLSGRVMREEEAHKFVDRRLQDLL